MKKLGILGGTFDPIHIGHLVMASYAIDILGLKKVLFMPAASPPHKQRDITSTEHRVRMCQLAVGLDSRFGFSDLDLLETGPSYTSELLQRVSSEYRDHEMFFLVGADSLVNFSTWHEPEEILRLASIGVAERPGSTVDEATRNSVPGLSERMHEFDSPLIELSSTEIRNRRAAGKSITYLVPEGVEDYIIENGLYRAQ